MDVQDEPQFERRISDGVKLRPRRVVRLIAGPELTGKGFDDREGQRLISEAEADLRRFLERSLRRGNMSYGYLVNRVKDTVANFVFKRAQLRPMILPVVTEF